MCVVVFFYLAYDLTAAQAIYEQTAAETLATSVQSTALPNWWWNEFL